MQNDTFHSPIRDARVHAVIERLRPPDGGPLANPAVSHDPHDYAEYGFSQVRPDRRGTSAL